MVRGPLGPGFGGDFGDLPVGHEGQAREHVAQIRVGIDPAPPAALNDRVDDRTAFSRPGVADEEPVFRFKNFPANQPLVNNLPLFIYFLNRQSTESIQPSELFPDFAARLGLAERSCS